MKPELTFRHLFSCLSLVASITLLTACGGSNSNSEDSDSKLTDIPTPSALDISSSSSSVLSTPANSSVSSSSVSSASSAGTAAKPTTPSVGGTLKWSHPRERENGQYLELDEIGGYELRYRESVTDPFKTVVIEDSTSTTFELGQLAKAYDYQIAAFDLQGLYSEFVEIDPE